MPRIFPVRIPVAATDIDANEHVNNLAYVRWMQEAAWAHSTAQGWTPGRYRELGAGWFVRSHFIEYLRPAHLGDVLTLHTWVGEMKAGSCVRRFLFLRDGTGEPVATARTRWAFVDLATGRPTRIPPEVASSFAVVADGDPELVALSPSGRSAPP